MKTIVILLIILLTPTLHSAEIIGLDSLDLGNNIEIHILKKSDYTGEIDTNIVYLLLFDNPKADKPNMLIKGSKNAPNNIYIAEDTMYVYIDSTMEYIKQKTNAFDFDNELFTFNYYLLKKQNPFTALRNFSNKIRLKSNTEVRPELNQIYNHSEFNHSNGSVSTVDLFIDTKNFDKLEYVSIYMENNDTLDQVYNHYIFKKSNDTNIFRELERFYVEDYLKYKEIDISSSLKVKPKIIAIGDTVDLNYTLKGINRENLNLKEFFTKNEYLFVYTWGTWCAPCLDNVMNVERFNKELNRPGFVTVMYEKGNASEKEKQIYVDRKKPNYPVYSSFDFVKNNNFYSFPTFAVIDKNGIILDIILGGTSDSFIYQKVLDEYNK